MQALQRVNNLYSLDGLDHLCQVKFAFRMETCVIKPFNPYKPGGLYLHRKQKITSEATKHRAQFDAVSFSFTLSIEQLHVMESSVTLDVLIIVTRLV